jgi:hypothetical protein
MADKNFQDLTCSDDNQNRQSQQDNKAEYRKLFFIANELNTSQIIENARVKIKLFTECTN